MNETAPTQPTAVTKVATHLTEIEQLAHDLLTQAVHKANDPLMPGGSAMVALGYVANQEAWEHRFEARESAGNDTSHVDDEDDTWEPPLQTLEYWSGKWRRLHDAEWDHIPTIGTEANFIRWSLNWAWDNEEAWDKFAADIQAAKRRLEEILYAGVRVERGVPCLYDECGGARLIRFIEDDGNRSDWTCSKCERTWDDDRYWANVNAANERAQREEIGTDSWCSVDYAAREVERSPKTIRTWINRGEISTACIIAGRRTRFVNLGEVRDKDEAAKRRGKKVVAA